VFRICRGSERSMQFALMAQLNSNAIRVPFAVQSVHRLVQILHPIVRSVYLDIVLCACALQ
jgi:hypothetical protein